MSIFIRARLACFVASVVMLALIPGQIVANGPIMGGYRKEVVGSGIVDTREAPLEISRSPAAQTRLRIPAQLLAGVDLQGSFLAGRSQRTILAGIALAVAAGFVFVVLGRRMRGNQTAVTAGVLILAAGFLVKGATADIPAPELEVHPTILIEIVDDGDAVELILGRNAV